MMIESHRMIDTLKLIAPENDAVNHSVEERKEFDEVKIIKDTYREDQIQQILRRNMKKSVKPY